MSLTSVEPNVPPSETWPILLVRPDQLALDECRYKYKYRTAELRCRLRFTSIPAQLVYKWLRWFGNAARRPNGELIKDLLLSTPHRTRRRRTGGQLKA